jgi:hypothetical protein
MEKKRNLWVIPTDEPSRLILRKDNKFILRTPITQWHGKNQNIYVTSDEEIKEGEYQLYNPLGNFNNAKVSKAERLLESDGRRKKIILTTDQDLIKDGVQAIDDEFLEWFVKNSSCEEVEVEKGYRGVDLFNYKIIIPKEELEQEKERGITITHVGKQETLEEASKRAVKSGLFKDETLFIAGVKWQQEQDKDKYSDEEVHKIIGSYEAHKLSFGIKFTYNKWFEQFKKK